MLDKATTFVYIGEVEQNSNGGSQRDWIGWPIRKCPVVKHSIPTSSWVVDTRGFIFLFSSSSSSKTLRILEVADSPTYMYLLFFWVHRPFYSLWSLGKVQFYKILASSSWVSLTLVTRGIHTITVASHYTSEMWRFFIPGNPFTWSEINNNHCEFCCRNWWILRLAPEVKAYQY